MEGVKVGNEEARAYDTKGSDLIHLSLLVSLNSDSCRFCGDRRQFPFIGLVRICMHGQLQITYFTRFQLPGQFHFLLDLVPKQFGSQFRLVDFVPK